MENKEYTGVVARNGDKIYVGDKLETVQGSDFEVVKLNSLEGDKYAIHDGERPYDLKSFMSPNLWIVSSID